jgi:hypothetical protein
MTGSVKPAPVPATVPAANMPELRTQKPQIDENAFATKPKAINVNAEREIVKEGNNVISKGEIRRIENAATRINKPIHLVGSRASGTAGIYSDWDYIIEGGIKKMEWNKIKNSLPGSRSILNNTPRNIDLLNGHLDKAKPHITIYPRIP